MKRGVISSFIFESVIRPFLGVGVLLTFSMSFVQPIPQGGFPGEFTHSFSPDTGAGVDTNNARGNDHSMSEACLACICQASTNCNLSTQCISNDKYCGPFLISKPYWIDAGQLTIKLDDPTRDGAFFSCAMDPVCSAQTVRTYMQRYHADCNADGIIDCDDMGRIHLMGSQDCGNPRVPTTPFFKRFKKCHDMILQVGS